MGKCTGMGPGGPEIRTSEKDGPRTGLPVR